MGLRFENEHPLARPHQRRNSSHQRPGRTRFAPAFLYWSIHCLDPSRNLRMRMRPVAPRTRTGVLCAMTAMQINGSRRCGTIRVHRDNPRGAYPDAIGSPGGMLSASGTPGRIPQVTFEKFARSCSLGPSGKSRPSTISDVRRPLLLPSTTAAKP